MFNKKIVAFVAMGALAACLALVGCGTQAASSSAASSSTSAAASASAATTSASAASASASASTPAASASAATPAASASSASSYIGDEAAKAAALAHAGLAAGDVTSLKVELDLNDAVVHYDVEFKSGGKEYDYDIDATSGAVLKSESKIDD